MSIGNWLRLRGRLRPWMVLVALAAFPAAGGCKKAESPAAAADGRAGGPVTSATDGSTVPQADEACPIATVYGPPPECSTDEQCVEQHGAGWVCESGTRELDDGCGGKIAWPFGMCRRAAPDAGATSATGESPDAADAEDSPAVEAVAEDATGLPQDVVEVRKPAEMAQSVRDLASITVGRVLTEDRLVTEPVGTYGAPDGTVAAPTGRGSVTLFGNVTISGSGTIDRAVVLRQVRRQTPSVRGCYERALAQNPELAGRLEFDVRISEDGGVMPTVAQNDAALETAGVTQCVLLRLRTVSFSSAPPQGGEVRARFGLEFRPAP